MFQSICLSHYMPKELQSTFGVQLAGCKNASSQEGSTSKEFIQLLGCSWDLLAIYNWGYK